MRNPRIIFSRDVRVAVEREQEWIFIEVCMPLLHPWGYCVMLVGIGICRHPDRHVSTGINPSEGWKVRLI